MDQVNNFFKVQIDLHHLLVATGYRHIRLFVAKAGIFKCSNPIVLVHSHATLALELGLFPK